MDQVQVWMDAKVLKAFEKVYQDKDMPVDEKTWKLELYGSQIALDAIKQMNGDDNE